MMLAHCVNCGGVAKSVEERGKDIVGKERVLNFYPRGWIIIKVSGANDFCVCGPECAIGVFGKLYQEVLGGTFVGERVYG